MDIIEHTYCGDKYRLEADIFSSSSKKVDIIIPVVDELEIFQYALRSLKEYTKNHLYNLYIVSNGSGFKTLSYLNELRSYLNKCQENINILNHLSISKYNASGSDAHALALNAIIGSGILTSENIFLMHADSAPLAKHWLDFMLSKIDEGNTAVGTYTNWEKDGIKFLHCSGVMVNRNFWLENNISARPNNPHYDTIGQLTLKLVEKDQKFYVIKNSRNNPELRERHLYNHERGSESFDDELNSIFGHQGRGMSNGDRGNWVRYEF